MRFTTLLKVFGILLLYFSLNDIVYSQNRIEVYTFNSNYTKFQSLAFTMGYKVKIIKGSSTSSTQSAPTVDLKNNPQAIIYDVGWINGESVATLRNFVKNGGCLVLFYTGKYFEKNELFQELFNISFVGDNIINKKSSGTYIFPSNSLPYIFQNYKIGGITDYDWCGVTGNIIALEAGEEYYLKSESSNKDRLVSFIYSLGNGKIMLLPGVFGTSSRTPDFNADGYYCRVVKTFIRDKHFDQLDHEPATKKLIQWLVGNFD